jgi:ribonucleoside-triphosphate reductase
MMAKCDKRCEIFSRVVGYYRPIENWNTGKREEFWDRVEYDVGGRGKKEEKEKKIVENVGPVVLQ